MDVPGADHVDHPRLAERPLRRPLQPGHEKGHALPLQVAHQRHEGLAPGRVDGRDRLGVEDQPPHRRGRGGDGLVHAARHVVRVGEEEPVVEPVHDHAGGRLGARMELHVGVAPQLLHPPQHGVVRAGAAAHHVDEREQDGEHQRLEHAPQHDTHGRDQRDGQLDRADAAQRAPFGALHQAGRGHEDDGAEAGARQVLDGLGQEQQDQRDRPGRHEPGHLRAGTDARVHRRARAAGRHGVGLGDPGGEVGDAHRGQLVARVHVLAGGPGERPRDEQGVREGHQEDAGAGQGEVAEVASAQARPLEGGQPRRNRADRGHAVGRQVEGGGRGDAADHHHEHPGDPGEDAAAAHQEGQRHGRHRDGGPAGLAEVRDDVAKLAEGPAGVHRDAQQLAELPHHEHQRHAADVAQQHRA